ncbi:MAG: FG-GAP-like repeat-containing protein [Myxococcales bacterium]
MNPATDDAHCGRCGNACIPGVTSCSKGACVAAQCTGHLEYADLLSYTDWKLRTFKVADLNGDGVTDVLARDYSIDRLALFFGAGDGTFSEPSFVSSAKEASFGDLDGDGTLDLVVSSDSLLSVLLGDGAGGFRPRVDYPTGASLFAVGDFTADGKPDVAFPVAFNTLRVLPNLGGGVLGPATEYTVPKCARTLLAGDFSGDGVGDLAILTGPEPDTYVSHCDAPMVTVLLTKPDGTFAPAAEYPLGSTEAATSMLAGDLDGDQSLDLLLAQGTKVVTLLNDGAGAFGAPLETSVAWRVTSSTLADFDGDSTLDLAVGVWTGADTELVGVLLGAGDGTFGPSTAFTATGPIDVAALDANLDGRPDIAVLGESCGEGSLGVLLNRGGGKFVARKNLQSLPTFSSPVAGDFDGDGLLELAVSTPSDGLGILDDLENIPSFSKLQLEGYPQPIGAEDLDHDGALDLVVLDATYKRAVVFGNLGDGTFSVRAEYPTGPGPLAGAVSDLDGDGQRDLVFVSGPSAILSVQLNAGNGVFLPRVDFPVGGEPISLSVADVNSDGRPDVVLPLQDSSSVTVVLNDGTGHFGAMASYDAGIPLCAVTVGDLNGDALPDLAASSCWGTMSVLLNDGAAGFMAGVEYPIAPAFSVAMAMGDMNGDGSLDLIVLHSADTGSVGILLNDGQGAFLPERRYSLGVYSFDAAALAVLDLNRDGRLDVMTGGHGLNVLLAHCF